MRFENVQDVKVYDKCASAGISGGMLKAVRLEMAYLPNLSKNSYKTRGGIIKSDVQRWMEQFSFMLRAMVNSQGVSFALPLKVKVDGVFEDRRSMPDLHNLLIVICDAVEDALGINDQFYKTETGQPEVGGYAKIIVEISSVGNPDEIKAKPRTKRKRR